MKLRSIYTVADDSFFHHSLFNWVLPILYSFSLVKKSKPLHTYSLNFTDSRCKNHGNIYVHIYSIYLYNKNPSEAQRLILINQSGALLVRVVRVSHFSPSVHLDPSSLSDSTLVLNVLRKGVNCHEPYALIKSLLRSDETMEVELFYPHGQDLLSV